jgi:cysteine desulfurase family protein
VHEKIGIYLDNAATTFPKPKQVIEAMEHCLKNSCVNAGRAVYELAQQASLLVSETRASVADLLGFKTGEIIFSPSATIALNQIIFGIAWKRGDVVYTTPLEHNSVMRPLYQLAERIGVEIFNLPLEPGSLIYDINEIQKAFFNNPPTAVVMSHVSNVCGSITPIEKIAEEAKKYDAIVVIDGAQAGPLVPPRETNNIDFYVFSGHKTFYGPFGIAGFWYNAKSDLKPILFGGTGNFSEELSMPEELPYKYEVGSHNIVAIAGLNAACKWLKEVGPANILNHERELMFQVVDFLHDKEEFKCFISEDKSSQTGIFSLVIDGYSSQEVASILDQEFNIFVRAGLHCAPTAHTFLDTMPLGTVRVSLSYFNSMDDIDCLVEALAEIMNA